MKKDLFYLYDMTSGEVMLPLGRMTAIEAENYESNSLRAISEKEMLAEESLKEIKRDVDSGDLTAVYELLLHTPKKYLRGFLREDLSEPEKENDDLPF
jgi:hypothetical protein